MSVDRAGRAALVGVVAGVSSFIVGGLVVTIGLAFHIGAAVTAIAGGVILLALAAWFFVHQIRVGLARRATRPDD
jgi:O-antigen/teichoic acid export membrane protein